MPVTSDRVALTLSRIVSSRVCRPSEFEDRDLICARASAFGPTSPPSPAFAWFHHRPNRLSVPFADPTYCVLNRRRRDHPRGVVASPRRPGGHGLLDLR